MASTFRRRAKRLLTVVGLLLVVLVLVLAARAAMMRSRQPATTPLADAPVDGRAVATHLAAAIRRKTITVNSMDPAPPDALIGLREDLETAFPRAHATLKREVIGERSLLFTWPGKDAGLAPVVLCAHLDVVPVEPSSQAADRRGQEWTHPAFDGVVDGEFVWGRGTLDDKGAAVSILAAIEALVVEGYVPRRTILLAFGHDEEISGANGAAKIVETLKSRGVKPEVVLDEGNPVVDGIVPGIAGPVAPIGIAEKGYISVDLSVDMVGGHSSIPEPDNAVGVLARAVERLRGQPMPARLDGPTAQFLAFAAPEMGFGMRVAIANLWLTSSLVERSFASAAATNASIRTTTAVTVLSAGLKDNVVPSRATAVVNFRILPGDTSETVLAHVRRTIADERVHVDARKSSLSEPSPVASTTSRSFEVLIATVRQVFPGTVVAPALFLAATDGRLYAPIANDVYRFLPVRMQKSDLDRIHGNDERVSITGLANAVRFYRQFARAMTE
jgi:carboxypeptidase PM20D1